MANVTLNFGEYHRAAVTKGGITPSVDNLDMSTGLYEKRDDAIKASGSLFIQHGATNVTLVSGVYTEQQVAELNARRAGAEKARAKSLGLEG